VAALLLAAAVVAAFSHPAAGDDTALLTKVEGAVPSKPSEVAGEVLGVLSKMEGGPGASKGGGPDPTAKGAALAVGQAVNDAAIGKDDVILFWNEVRRRQGESRRGGTLNLCTLHSIASLRRRARARVCARSRPHLTFYSNPGRPERGRRLF
jgi:hypothetical protein